MPRSTGILTPEAAVALLVEHRLLSNQIVVDEGLEIEIVSSRNRGLRIDGCPGHRFFIKQSDPDYLQQLEIEVELYRRIHHTDRYPCLRQLTPRYHAYHPGLRSLILELL